jgi:acyl-CoA-dependent ceramide synthase
LQIAKCLKYLGYSTICDYVFGLFIVVWFASRHVVYPLICYSIWADIPVVMNYGCYSGKKGNIAGPFPPPDRFGHLLAPFRDPEGIVCFDHKIKWMFLSALLSLQGIILMWFWMIMRIALKALRGAEVDDIRSDDEGEIEDAVEEFMEELHVEPPPPYEEEVGVESLNLKGRTSNASKNRYRKSPSSTSGVSLPDRKELLGRIGCDKGQ